MAEACRPCGVGEGRGGRNDSVCARRRRRRLPQPGVLLQAQPCEQETGRNVTDPQRGQTMRGTSGRARAVRGLGWVSSCRPEGWLETRPGRFQGRQKATNCIDHCCVSLLKHPFISSGPGDQNTEQNRLFPHDSKKGTRPIKEGKKTQSCEGCGPTGGMPA